MDRSVAQEAYVLGIALGSSVGSKIHIVGRQSRKQRRVASSSIVAEAIAANAGVAPAFHLRSVLSQFSLEGLPVKLIVDSKGLHRSVATQRQPRDKSASIAVHQLCIDLEKGNLKSVVWIKGCENPCDALTKPLSGQTASILDNMLLSERLPIGISNMRDYGAALHEEE